MFIYTLETVFTVLIFLIFFLILAYQRARIWWKERNCDHLKIYRTPHGDKCSGCGKKLGFRK